MKLQLGDFSLAPFIGLLSICPSESPRQLYTFTRSHSSESQAAKRNLLRGQPAELVVPNMFPCFDNRSVVAAFDDPDLPHPALPVDEATAW